MSRLNLRNSRLLIITLLLVLLVASGCFTRKGQAHSFSNFLMDGNALWLGAGYHLYRIDMEKGVVTLTRQFDDVIITHIAKDKDRVYVAGHHSPYGNEAVIRALDPTSGDILWEQSFKAPLSGTLMSPLLLHEDILIVSVRNSLRGLNTANGEVKWRLSGIYFGLEGMDPVIENGYLIYGYNSASGSSESKVVIADPASGETIRSIPMSRQITGSPAQQDECFYVTEYESSFDSPSGENTLFLNCMDLSTAATLWTYSSVGVPDSSRLTFYNGLILRTSADQLHVLDAKSGSLQWQSPPIKSWVINPQVVDDLNLAALEAPNQKKVYFVDINTHELQTITLEEVRSSPLFIGKDALYGVKNTVFRTDLSTGKTIWSVPVDSQYEIIIDLDANVEE